MSPPPVLAYINSVSGSWVVLAFCAFILAVVLLCVWRSVAQDIKDAKAKRLKAAEDEAIKAIGPEYKLWSPGLQKAAVARLSPERIQRMETQAKRHLEKLRSHDFNAALNSESAAKAFSDSASRAQAQALTGRGFITADQISRGTISAQIDGITTFHQPIITMPKFTSKLLQDSPAPSPEDAKIQLLYRYVGPNPSGYGEIVLIDDLGGAVTIHSTDPKYFPIGTRYADFKPSASWEKITGPVTIQFSPVF
jgi:hypothetical protein